MSSFDDIFSEGEAKVDKTSPKKPQSPQKVSQKATLPPPPPPPSASKASQPLVSIDANLKRLADAQTQHGHTQDLLLRCNRMLAESTENFSKVIPQEQGRFIDAVRDLHALTTRVATSFDSARDAIELQAKTSKDLLVALSQQQQLVERLLERLPVAPVATTGRVRAPAPEVAAPKGLDNESKSDRAKRLKKEKDDAAAAAAALKKDDTDADEKKVTAGDKRKAASPEREKKPSASSSSSSSSSKIKGDHPAEKKQKVTAAKKKPTAAKKKSKSDDESSASSASESEDDEPPRTPKKKAPSRSGSPAPPQTAAKAQPMDD